MPKTVLILLAAISLAAAAAACHNSSGPTPTPGPTVSFSPDPKIKVANVYVTILGKPAAKIPVEESTPSSKTSPRPGTPFDTQTTNHKGKTKFHNLTPSQTYCWVALLRKGATSSTCAGWEIWQSTPINLGT